MLKDAALLHLELLRDALEEDIILKDASAFNVQWRGSQPVFIDTPSFEPLRPGEPWVGYRQFCQLFLYPLMLQAYKGIAFQPFLRGSIEGITPDMMNRLMSWRDLLKPGVLAHVLLHAKLQSRHAETSSSYKNMLETAGFSKELIIQNVRKLHRLISRLNSGTHVSEWGNYADDCHYADADTQTKSTFVEEAARIKPRKLVWDLGANTGRYSRIVSAYADFVVAMDQDVIAVDRLYSALKQEGNHKILPLVMNLADPSPALGWQGLERKPMVSRGTPDLTLCLALIHHLVIGANIPMHEIIEWLAQLKTSLVIEFVAKDDPMVRKLLLNKTDQYSDYDIDHFEQYLTTHFKIQHTQSLASGNRMLYYAEPLG